MAARPSSTSSRPSTGRVPTSRQATGRGGRPAPRKPAARRTSKARSGGLPLPLRAIRGTWMGVSHLAGGAVRRVGSSARDLEPEHRRDGVGFALIGLAVVVAAREWWGVQGVVGDVIHAVVAGTLGRVGYAVPLVLLAFGLYFLRAPKDDGVTNRLVVGTVALTFAACGLAHISDGIPNPPGGADPMRAAGGIIGFLASSPLASAVSRPGAVVLLVLLALFGALVVTGTPVRQIPQRVRDLRNRLIHGADDDAADPTTAVTPTPRSRRRAVDLLEKREGDEAFEQAAVVAPGRGRRLRPGEKRPGPDEAPTEAASPTEKTAPQTGLGPQGGARPAAHVDACPHGSSSCR